MRRSVVENKCVVIFGRSFGEEHDNGSGVQFSLLPSFLLLSPVPEPGTSEKLGRLAELKKIPASLAQSRD